MTPARRCAWCHGPIPARARRDAIYCRTLCRQAHHRFAAGAQRRVAVGRPLRLAYADPPYPANAGLYADHPDYAGEVDHAELLGRLAHHYPDGWALSTSATALPQVLALCPPGTRVAAWVRGERPVRHLRPLNAWEPVLYHGGRDLETAPDHRRRVDVLAYTARARRSDPRRVIGAKPSKFAFWVFDLLGALPHDYLEDLYPGSGGIGRAWEIYAGRGPTAQPKAATG